MRTFNTRIQMPALDSALDGRRKNCADQAGQEGGVILWILIAMPFGAAFWVSVLAWLI